MVLNHLLTYQPEDANRALLELAIHYASADEASLLALDTETNELEFIFTVNSKSSEQVLKGQRVPVGEGITGMCAMTRDVHVGRPTYDKVTQSEKSVGKGIKPELIMAAPLLLRDELIGVLTLCTFDENKEFEVKDVQFFGRIAMVASKVLEQSQRLMILSNPDNVDAAGLSEDEIELAGSIQVMVKRHPGEIHKIAEMMKIMNELLD